MVNLTLMRVQLAGLEQILIQVAFILTKIASMAQTIDTDWFQLWFFITGDEIIIFKQLVSKCCAFICYEFFIVTTSALYRDSMIAEIIKIYEKHETLLRIFLGRGFSHIRLFYPLSQDYKARRRLLQSRISLQ